jgi:cysteine-rich repeat protein
MVRVVGFALVVLAGCGGLVQAQGTTGDGDSGATSAAPDDSGPSSGATPDPDTSGSGSGSGGQDGVVPTGDSSSGSPPESSTGSGSGSESDGASASSDGGSADGGPPDCGDGKKDGGEDCDDANASEIDGCTSACAIGPIGLQYGDASTTEEDGGNGTNVTPFSDDCPEGQVLTGLTGRLTSQGLGAAVVLGRIQGECSALSLQDADPTAIDSAPGASLIEHGGFQEGGDWQLTCPDGSVITEFEGRAGSIIDSLEVTCTPLQIDGTGSSQSLELGTPSTEGPAGGNGGADFGPVACPNGEIAAGLAGDTNSYVIRLALRCRSLELAYP